MPKQIIAPPLELERKLLKRYPNLLEDISIAQELYGGRPVWRDGSIWITCDMMGKYGRIYQPGDYSLIQLYALWREGRTIYEYSPELAETLVSQDVPTVPCEALRRLPQWCTCITGFDASGRIAALYAYIDESELIMVWQHANGLIYTDMVNLINGVSVIDAMRETIREKKKLVANTNIEFRVNLDRERATRGINLILYLCAENAEIQSPHKKVARTSTPQDPDAPAAATIKPTSYNVGVRIGAAIRAALAAREVEINEVNVAAHKHASPIPHIRRAHYATYWTGEGRKIPVVRWIEPILVGVKRVDGEVPTTIRPVLNGDANRT